jgi:hypothetical protein
VRVTSALFVAALVRRVFSEGAAAAVVRRGSEEAGAIFLIVYGLTGRSDLYGPAPQAIFDERPADRVFQRLIEAGSAEEVSARLAREQSFDPDLWVVAIEDRDGREFFTTI